MSNVSFNGFREVNGKLLANGMASKFDIQELVEMGLVKHKKIIKDDENKIAENANKTQSFMELKNILNDFKSVNNKLKHISYENNYQSIFNQNIVKYGTNAGLPGDKFVNVSFNQNADLFKGSYEIQVNKLAKFHVEQIGQAGQYAFTDLTSSIVQDMLGTAQGMFKAGSFKLNNIDITLQEGNNLTDVVEQINSHEDETGVRATIVRVADNDYRIMLRSKNTGIDNIFTIQDNDAVFGLVNKTVTQAAQNADFSINGMGFVNNSNSINDIMGMNFELLQPTNNSMSFQISVDTNSIKEQITQFTQAYNKFLAFIDNQNNLTMVDDPNDPRFNQYVYADDAHLHRDPSLTYIETTMRDELLRNISEFSSNFTNLYSIGIDLKLDIGDNGADSGVVTTRKYLYIDEVKLDHALKNNLEDVRKLFELDFNFTNDNFQLAKNGDISSFVDPISGHIINEFNIDIDINRDNSDIVRVSYFDNGIARSINAEFIPNDPNDLTIGGNIKGLDGSIFSGLEFRYMGEGIENTNLNFNQGISYRMSKMLEIHLDAEKGTIAQATNNIESRNIILKTEYLNSLLKLEEHKSSLINQYAKMEEAISKLNNILTFLDSLDKARDAANR